MVVQVTPSASTPLPAPAPSPPVTLAASATGNPADTPGAVALAQLETPSPSSGGAMPSIEPASSSLSSTYADRGIPADLIPDAQPAARLPETTTRSGFYLQLGAFRVRAGADSFASHVAREIDPLVASKVQVSDLSNGLYRVRIGPYAQRAEADGAALTLRSAIAQPVMVMPEGATR